MANLKKVIVLLVTVLLIVGISVQVNASGIMDLNNFIATNETTNTTTNTTTNITTNTTTNITTNTTTNTTGGTVIQPTTNKTTNGVTGNNLPQTGVTEDITVAFFIIVCAISAIYAYKKIRDYRS